MALNENWTRWILASILHHFDSLKQTLILTAEGEDRPVTDSTNHVEIRIDGPSYTEVSKNFWRAYLEINALVFTVDKPTDLWQQDRNIGIITAAVTNTIYVSKYGDDGLALGCLELTNDPVQIRRFGRVDSAMKVLQATVEGHYRMDLETVS